MLKVKIYGTGSDGNMSTIEDETSAILIDCGLPLNRLNKEVIKKLQACIITHYHRDHAKYYKDVKDIMQTIDDITKTKVGNFEIETTPTSHSIKNMAAYIFNDDINILWGTDFYSIEKYYTDMNYLICEISYDLVTLGKAQAEGDVSFPHYCALHSHMSLDRFLALLRHTNLATLKGIIVLHSSKYLNRNLTLFEINKITNSNVPVYLGRGEYYLDGETILKKEAI